MDLFDDNLLGAPAARPRLGGKFAPKRKSKQSLRKEIAASEHATSSEDRKDMNVASISTVKQDSEKISQNECHNVVIADSIGFEVGSVTKSIPETDLNNESELNNVASPSSTTCSTIGRVKESLNNGECSFLDSNKTLEVNNSLQAGPIVDFKSSSGNSSAAISENNIQSIFNSGKVQEDANEKKSSLRKCKRSSFAGVEDGGGKSTRQLRKQKTCEPVKNSNSLIEDDDELDPPYVYNNDEEEEEEEEEVVDYPSKKKRALKSSKHKYVAKNGKTYKKHKENSDSENTTKEPPKKFSHSSRRRKICVDQTLLDDYERDSRSMSIRKIIAVSNYKKQLEKKEPKSSTNQSGGDFFHDTGANYEEETFGSDDDIRDHYDNQASEKFTSTIPLYNHQSFTDKPLRVKWSKQDTEKFYEALREFGPDFGLIQQIFPGKTRCQIKLKYKNEDRQRPLQITDAMHSRSTDHSLYKSVIAKVRQIATSNANQEAMDDSEDMSPGINEEVATSKQDCADIKDQDDIMTYNNSPEQSDDCDDDLPKWSQYQSSI